MKEIIKQVLPGIIKWGPWFLLLAYITIYLVPEFISAAKTPTTNVNDLKEYYQYKLETELRIKDLQTEIEKIKYNDSLKNEQMNQRDIVTTKKIQNFKQLKPDEKVPAFIDQYNRVRNILKRSDKTTE